MKFLKEVNKAFQGILIFFIMAAPLYLAWNYFKATPIRTFIIGAGSPSGEAYQFATAIAEVTKTHYPHINIIVKETAGSKENMDLLEANSIHLATVQADIKASPSARLITNLYPDMYQLIVRKDAGINNFADLKGKRIALPTKGGGQELSFWFTAHHYGITKEDIINVPLTTAESVKAIINGKIDAIFRVRAPRNKTILHIIDSSPTKLIPIDQVRAMQLEQPALHVGEIPKGAYSASPFIPAENLPTIAINRLLIGHANTDSKAVKIVTRILFERRLELLQMTPLAGFISQPNWDAGTFIPIHQGAQSFYDHERPSYFEENLDFIALMTSIAVLLISIFIGLRIKAGRNKKDLADQYTNRLILIMQNVGTEKGESLHYLQSQKNELHRILAEVINELDNEGITLQGFHFFSFIWDKVYTLICEKEESLNA